MELSQRFRGCLLGLAAGDAVGTSVEFQPPGTFLPVKDMTGGGPFGLQPGQWTDDTSMALCLAASLVECGGFDPADQVRRYDRWFRKGYMSSTGRCFDIGGTVRQALEHFEHTGDPFSGQTHAMSAGNGSIMRLAPVVLFFFPDRDKVLHFSEESSRTTHATRVCLDACRLLGEVLYRVLSGADKEAILFRGEVPGISSPAIKEIGGGTYRHKTEDQIEGSGYVVKTLEAALWCFWKTASFEEAILMTANLGDDADTTAAVCGQVAGAFYGESGIPAKWLDRLARGEEIAGLADRLARWNLS